MSKSSNKMHKFIHISTDEVFGSLEKNDAAFSEASKYDPSSPYSASKAASDHLVKAWGRTFGLPYIITNCSNNFGPYQFPEKFIPHTIINAIQGNKIPIYGNGRQIRDWLYVEDHISALIEIGLSEEINTLFNIGANCEKENIEVANIICEILDQKMPINASKKSQSYKSQIEFVSDRPGHDKRYAINSSKLINTLSWKAQKSFEENLEKTIEWYINNSNWWQEIIKSKYKLERLGNKAKIL
ncbi:NAD-dependent epimerase/dehydratase family protein [archaeon]|nr:NAD-dependent epimerase/dehydratase family protein [archaeon]